MPIITDPDLLNDGQEIQINPSAKTIRLSATGNLTSDGVTVKCVYSKLKELWRTNATYIKYAFPMGPITDEQFEMINGWDWHDNTTRYLLRTGGWAKKDANGNSEQEWACIITLGNLGSTDQVYFQQGPPNQPGSAAVNFQLTGPVNQAIQTYLSGAGGFDYRSYLKLFCRVWGKTYAMSQLSDIGVSTMTYQTYRFPLANAADPKITQPMSAMSGAPYSNVNITWYNQPQQRNIGGVNYNFQVIINGANLDAEEIYQRVQYLLTLNSDIDAGTGTQIGKTASPLLRFVGDTLYTMFYTISPTGGTYIDNFQSDDINRLVFVDNTNTERVFPYTAVLTINFGDNLKNDANARYWVFFTDVPGGNYGDSDAIIVRDADNVPMSGTVGGSASIQRTFAYDTNNQGGRTPGTDAPITAVAIGLNTAQFVKAESIIKRSTANSVSLVAALERNYANP